MREHLSSLVACGGPRSEYDEKKIRKPMLTCSCPPPGLCRRRGGFAACYKASWTAPGAKSSVDIALKVLLPLLCEPKNLYFKHFIDEAAVLAVLDHP
jgi:hypothetical protein